MLHLSVLDAKLRKIAYDSHTFINCCFSFQIHQISYPAYRISLKQFRMDIIKANKKVVQAHLLHCFRKTNRSERDVFVYTSTGYGY